MRIYMQIPAVDDQPPRFYQIMLQRDLMGGWSLVREWGRQGVAGRIRREHFPDLEAAQAALVKVRDAQLARGYRVVFTQGGEPAP